VRLAIPSSGGKAFGTCHVGEVYQRGGKGNVKGGGWGFVVPDVSNLRTPWWGDTPKPITDGAGGGLSWTREGRRIGVST